jgi:hypothetical protein
MGFLFVKKSEPHDIAFGRVGNKSGLITVETRDCNPNFFYFIKFEKEIDLDVLKKISWDDVKNNTAKPCCISKRDIIIQFNKFLT